MPSIQRGHVLLCWKSLCAGLYVRVCVCVCVCVWSRTVTDMACELWALALADVDPHSADSVCGLTVDILLAKSWEWKLKTIINLHVDVVRYYRDLLPAVTMHDVQICLVGLSFLSCMEQDGVCNEMKWNEIAMILSALENRLRASLV